MRKPRVMTSGVPRTRAWTALAPWLLALLVLLTYGGAYLARARQPGGALAFAVLGTANTPGNRGYDGQYYYRIAVDPLGGRHGLDRPAYRYQRILYPLLARALALSARPRVAAALVLLNVAAIALGVLFLGMLLRRNGASPLYALLAALYAGQVGSFWRDLAEPLSFALVGASLLFMPYLWKRWQPPAAVRAAVEPPITAPIQDAPPDAATTGPSIWLAALLLLAAVLTKETALLFAIPIAASLALRRAWPALRTLALIVALPYCLWQAALWLVFGQPGVSGADHPPLLPLGGLAGVRSDRVLLFDLLVVALPALLCLALAGLGGRRLWREARMHVLAADRWLAGLRVARDAPMLVLLANVAFVLWLPARSYADLWAAARNADGLLLAALIHPAFSHTRLRRLLLALWGASAPLLWLQ